MNDLATFMTPLLGSMLDVKESQRRIPPNRNLVYSIPAAPRPSLQR